MRKYIELSKKDQKAVLHLILVIVILLLAPSVLNLLLNGGEINLDYEDIKKIEVADSARNGLPSIAKSTEHSLHRISINTATAEELETIPGLPKASIFKIINYRNRNGAFTEILELKNAGLIDEQVFDLIQPHIRL